MIPLAGDDNSGIPAILLRLNDVSLKRVGVLVKSRLQSLPYHDRLAVDVTLAGGVASDGGPVAPNAWTLAWLGIRRRRTAPMIDVEAYGNSVSACDHKPTQEALSDLTIGSRSPRLARSGAQPEGRNIALLGLRPALLDR